MVYCGTFWCFSNIYSLKGKWEKCIHTELIKRDGFVFHLPFESHIYFFFQVEKLGCYCCCLNLWLWIPFLIETHSNKPDCPLVPAFSVKLPTFVSPGGISSICVIFYSHLYLPSLSGLSYCYINLWAWILALKLWAVLQEMDVIPAALFSLSCSSSWIEFFLLSVWMERMTVGAGN